MARSTSTPLISTKASTRVPAADKVNYNIQRNAYESKFLAGYNGLSASVIGLKMKEDLARVGLPGWSLIGVLEAGVNPYSGMFAQWPALARR